MIEYTASLGDRVMALTTRVDALDAVGPTSLLSRITAIEDWKNSPRPASANTPNTFNLPTFIISLGLNAPTKAGIEAVFVTLANEINGIKGVLRDKGLMAT